MSRFARELELLADDAVAVLGSRTVTLRRPTIGSLDIAARTRAASPFTDYEVSAIKGTEDRELLAIGADSSARMVRCLYVVRTADVAAPPARTWTLIDDGVTWQITEVVADVDGMHWDLTCTRSL